MNKRLTIGIIILLGLIAVIPLAYNHHLDQDVDSRKPNGLSSYPDVDYFKIDPKTILVSLDEGNADVFTPLQEDPDSVESLTNISFSWTQADILKIVAALGQVVWDDPMDLRHWSVYDVYFRKDCGNNPDGFDAASITDFKEVDVNGARVYATRYVEINPYYSMVISASGATYSQPILYKRKGVDLAGATITADDALRISEEHGGKEARQKVDNKCLIMVNPTKIYDRWNIYYIPPADFFMQVDFYTGHRYKPQTTKQ